MPKIGLLGCGAVAQYDHLPVIAATSDLQLVAAYDQDAKRAAQTAARNWERRTSTRFSRRISRR